jgi:lysophospholipase L1-like esterase
MTTKSWLRISVTIHILTVLFFVGKRIYYYRAPETALITQLNTAGEYNYLKNSVFSELIIDSTDTVMIGTSITEGFPVADLLSPNIKNRGIGWNTSKLYFSRIGDIINQHPAVIILEASINDFIVENLTAKQSFENLLMVVNRIVTNAPKTKLFIQSLLPTSGNYGHLMPRVKELNRLLADYCKAGGIAFINLYPLLGGDEGMPKQYSADGVHPNGKGYKVMAGEIGKRLNP